MREMNQKIRYDKIEGALLGTAVGDALGLPREGLSRRRAMRIFGGKPLHHNLFLKYGMFSDDTEHACMVAQALLASQGNLEKFAESLAWQLRFWLLGIPAGVGLATLRSICKLWCGFPPNKSGVYSAGNGPAMRASVLGIFAGSDTNYLKGLVAVSSRLTHTDERAEQGALAVVLACQYAMVKEPENIRVDEIFEIFREHITNPELMDRLTEVKVGIETGLTASEMADRMGLSQGVSGYIVHTVPMAIFCWLRYCDDFRTSIEEVVLLGGDTDTTAAIVGALAGASGGSSRIPSEWITGIKEWPRSMKWIRTLAVKLTQHIENKSGDSAPLNFFWPSIVLRNIFFTIIVLLHGFRRLLPPY